MNHTSFDEPLTVGAQSDSDQAATIPTDFPKRNVLFAATLLLGWLVLCDAVMVPMALSWSPSDTTAFVMFIIAGCFLSQLGLLAAWNVWGPIRYWLRISIGWGIATILVAVWVAGAMFGHWMNDAAFDMDDVPPLVVWPLVSVVLETPLWGLKTIFGARFVRSGDSPDRSLAISDLLAGMLVAGVALALARLGRRFMDVGSETEFWAGLGAIGGIGAIITVTILPLLALTTTRVRSGLASLSVTVLVLLVFGLLPQTVTYLVIGPPGSGILGAVAGFLIPACAAATIAAAFGIARLAGYRFQFGRSSSTQSSAAQAES